VGDSRYSSNIKAGGSAVTISGFSSVTATNITVSGTLTAPIAATTSYIKLGDHQYILFGGLAYLASIVPVATAIDASCQGSLYLSSDGKLAILESDTAASFIPF